VTRGIREEEGPGGLPFLVVDTERCRARLTPYGAQVCEWAPAGQAASVLFLSPRAVFGAGSAIRGGVPVCFPWFAAHPSDPAKPAHGFARTQLWRTGAIGRDESGDVDITFHLASDAQTRVLWDAEFAASLTVTLGTALTMTFTVENTGAAAFECEIALHSYLAVGDAAQTRVSGLERTRFIDKVDAMREHTTDDAPLAFSTEVDRIFVDTTSTCTIDDPILARKIQIEKTGSPVTVVWNPGPQKGPAVRDLGDAWSKFVCVETAHCRPLPLRVSPQGRHAMTARISVSGRA
jgi:glucose-6-phosphate 1-epimerase